MYTLTINLPDDVPNRLRKHYNARNRKQLERIIGEELSKLARKTSNTIPAKAVVAANPEFFKRVAGRRVKKNGMVVSEFINGRKVAEYSIDSQNFTLKKVRDYEEERRKEEVENPVADSAGNKEI